MLCQNVIIFGGPLVILKQATVHLFSFYIQNRTSIYNLYIYIFFFFINNKYNYVKWPCEVIMSISLKCVPIIMIGTNIYDMVFYGYLTNKFMCDINVFLALLGGRKVWVHFLLLFLNIPYATKTRSRKQTI